MKSKKSSKGTTRKRSEASKPRVKDLAPTGRKAKAVKGGSLPRLKWETLSLKQ